MNRWRQWSASLISRVDWMVSMVENHEALADSAIRDLQRHAARAKVQMGRVRADGRRLQEALAREREAVGSWRERARRLGDADEGRALECLRRARTAEQRAHALSERAGEHERIETQLARDLARVEERLGALRSQRNLMRTRQSRADALSAVNECGEGLELEEIFDRWDIRITERELATGCGLEGDDAFESTLADEEIEAELRHELRDLLDGPADPPEAR